MGTFLAFLRGINISGKNKLAMGDLKAALEQAGFSAVRTVLNSGNVRFDTDRADLPALRGELEGLLRDRFGLAVPVFVIERDALAAILRQAPDRWGNGDKGRYDNLILILSDDTPEGIAELLGPPTEGLERVLCVGGAIFWSFDRAAYRKCSWWKRTAQNGIAERLTIRTAGTVRKLCGV